jgi:hypothetical protein
MDAKTIWHEHQRVILAVTGGALGFLVLSMILGRLEASTERLARSNQQRQQDILADLGRLRHAEGLEKSREAALSGGAEARVLRDLEFAEARFPDVLDTKRPFLVASQKLDETLAELRSAANRKQAKLPAGLGLREEKDDVARIPEALATNAVVRHLVLLLLEQGVREIGAIEPGAAEYREIEGQSETLRRLPVRVIFVGHCDHLAAILAAMAESGHFLELVRCDIHHQAKTKLDEGTLEVALEVAALNRVGDEERPASAQLSAAGGTRPKSGGGGSGGGRKTWWDLRRK